MRRPARRRPKRRPTLGARVSAGLQRWPARNYFAEMQPDPKETHPVDDLMDHHPVMVRIGRRTRRLLARVQKHAKIDDLLDFEAERTLLDSTRVEVAFNLGFEGGLVRGRSEALGRATRRAGDRDERLLLQDLRALLAGTKSPPGRVEALLLELAWAFALGGGPPGGAESIRPRRT
ncbi:MAG TPA: hypothetical protein VKZ18_09930 [Polyangia bacterium]|nr:hypothetical protein [Polyangia bacterium]